MSGRPSVGARGFDGQSPGTFELSLFSVRRSIHAGGQGRPARHAIPFIALQHGLPPRISDSVDVAEGTDDDQAVGNGGCGHDDFADVVPCDQNVLAAGFQHVRVTVFVDEVQPSVCGDGRGRKGASDSTHTRLVDAFSRSDRHSRR